MAVLSSFVFFNEDSTSTTSNELMLPNGTGSITLQVDTIEEGTFSIYIEGLLDLSQPQNFHKLKGVSLGSFNTVSDITASGIYMFTCSGLTRVRAIATSGLGNIKVYAVAVE